MASLGVLSIGGGGGGNAVRLTRVEEPLRRRTLALLLTGGPNGQDPAVDEFLRFADSQGLDVGELWGALEGDRPLAAALLVPSAGRTGMVFCSPLHDREHVATLADLLRAMVAAQSPARMRLLQSLLDPQQHREGEALADAGFVPLASLIYMQRAAARLGSRVAREEFGPGLRVVHWEPAAAGLFERAIVASYVETLDCPKLLGLRDVSDVVAGHMATGRFDPAMWFVLLGQDDEPAAVMLLNELPGRSAVELVYLGLSVPWRRRGLARRLLEHGIDLAARRGLGSVLLAVDEANTPALGLYRGLGFRPTTRKRAVIRTLAVPDKDGA